MTTDEITSQEMAELATSRSRVYGFLGALYNRIPDEPFAASLSSPELGGFLSSLGQTDAAPEDMRAGLFLVQAYITAVAGRSIEELTTELAVERTRLLRGIKPGYGPPPPYASVYLARAEAQNMLAMAGVRNIYAESGVALPENIHDQPDFIGFELDFMRHMTETEASAWAADDRVEVAQILAKEQSFVLDHIVEWVPRFCDLMLEDAKLDFYRGIARLTKGFVQSESQTIAALLDEARVATVA